MNEADGAVRVIGHAYQPTQVIHRVWLADALVNLARHHLTAGSGAFPRAREALHAARDLYEQVEQTHPDAAHDRFRAAVALLAEAGGDTAIKVPAPSPKDAGRYYRRWAEVAIRSSLPGVAAIAAWRTDLAPPSVRRRTIREELIALFDRHRTTTTDTGPAVGLPTATAATTAATASPDDQRGRLTPTAMTPSATAVPPGRIAAIAAKATDRLRSVVNAAGTRIAGLPGVDAMIQFAQSDPAALARIAGVVAVLVVLLTGMPSLNPTGPQAQPPQPPSSVLAAPHGTAIT